MTNFYLITTFVVLLAGAEAAEKATSGTQHLHLVYCMLALGGRVVDHGSYD
jgi:hypothetical protein